jgi:hypothetical protein
MAAANFSDDAYNKRHQGPHAGTLIGNWSEERTLRDATGEGRTVPQRHLKRSGLLKDFTKQPSEGPRKTDNTFERVYGPNVDHKAAPASKVIGDFKEKKVNHVGPKEQTLRQMRLQHAEADTLQEEAEVAEQGNERFFQSAYMLTHTKPDETQAKAADHLRQGKMQELKYGPPPERALASENQGLEHDHFAHYSNAPEPTHHRMALGDSTMRNDMKVSASGGIHPFGKHSEFTKPVSTFTMGPAKDEELESMYKGLQESQPLRSGGACQPHHGAFAKIPSLPAMKANIQDRLLTNLGSQGYVLLRQRLFDVADFEGFVTKTDIIAIFRDLLQFSKKEYTDDMLDAYFEQLVTMKKHMVRVAAFMTSMRPALPLKDRRRVVDAFTALQPVDGTIKLGAWLSTIQDAGLRATIVNAFGAQDEFGCADTGLTEAMFVELLSDLAALGDIGPLI